MTKKYVNHRRHPSKNYELRCYNKKAFFDRHWNEDTIHARGHVYADDGTMLSVPFPKFFNIDENQYSQMTDVSRRLYADFDNIVRARKYNGHLSIMFHDGEEWVNTTKGSFDHDFVALDRLVIEDSGFTEEVLDSIPTHWTLCFEIIADYDHHLLTQRHKEDFDMVNDFAILLGINDRDSGMAVDPRNWAPFLNRAIQDDSGGELFFAEEEPLGDVVEAFDSPESAAAWLEEVKATETFTEGYIFRDVTNDWRIKVKTDWFVYERYKFQFNAERTRNIFKKYYDSEEAFAKIPEEFHNRYSSVLTDFATFLNGIEINMMASMERIHESGLLMRHEIEDFIQSNEKLTVPERSVMMAYIANKGYQGRAFDMFCETYKGFSLVDKLE